MENLLLLPTNELLDEFGAGKATPGSGCAAALMGLLACKLAITVCKIGQRNCGDNEAKRGRFEVLISQFETSSVELTSLFEKDAQEFQVVADLMVSRKQTKDSSKRSKLTREINDRLEIATDNIFEIADICFRVVSNANSVFDEGPKHVRGDSGAAISVALAAVSSCLFIGFLNLKTLKGRQYAVRSLGRCEGLQKRFTDAQSNALNRVLSLDSEAMKSIQGDLL